jgi:TRAP-type C4-dicarboxylate transport system permease small subunit
MKVWWQWMESRGNSFARFCAVFGTLALIAFILMTNFDVLMRWLFNRPINGVSDVGPLVAAIVTAAFFPFALTERSHVSMDLLGSLLGPRARLWLNAFAALVTWLFFVLLAWQIIRYTVELQRLGETTWVVQLPVSPWWSVVSFFMVVCAVVQLSVVVAEISRARDRRDGDQQPPARSDDTSV